MNILDLFILLIAVLEAVQGARIGLLRQFFSLTGFWLGLVLGAIISPFLASIINEPSGKLAITFTLIFGLAVLFGILGRLVGHKLARVSGRRQHLQAADNILGAAFSVIVSMFIIWLFVSMFSGSPYREFNRSIRESVIVGKLNVIFPPAPAIISQIARLINPYGFPHVFVGPERNPSPPVDPASASQIESATKAARASTVKIQGIGCGGLVNGSGFIAATDLVITNAHVVAGIERPVVIDDNGWHRANTVYFDSSLDIAILRTTGLTGRALAISGDIALRGTAAVILGYPAGGSFKASSASVSGQYEALGRDIYNQRVVLRSIYELQTSLESGNSGGPLVLPDGTVIGIIFARSEITRDTGYAIIAANAQKALAVAQDNPHAVSTGRCIAR